MQNVAGLSSAEAQKSTDMYMKCRYMDELTGSIKTRKAIKVIVDSAVPVAPKAEEKTEE